MVIEEFERAERWAAAHHAVALVVQGGKVPIPQASTQIDGPRIDELVQSMEGFLVAAFDAESWIVWSADVND
jgi:hypothetical protein